MPMPTDHLRRVTMRFIVGGCQRESDLTIPASCALADVLPEAADLCAAPRPARPWQARTPAGVLIDAAVALAHTPVRDGSLIIVEPTESRPAPVIRDAAEALAATDSRHSPWPHGDLVLPERTTATLCCLLGAVGLAALAVPWLPAWAIAGILGGSLLAIVVWCRELTEVCCAAISCLVASGALWVSAGASGALAHASLPAVIATATLLGVLGVLIPAWLRIRGWGVSTVCAGMTALALVGCGLGGWAISRTLLGASAAVCAAGMGVLLSTPGLATALSGLRVPVLPTAGEDLAASDTADPHVTQRAARARRIHTGITAGVAASAGPALVLMGLAARQDTVHSAFGLVLGIAVAGGVIFHGLRHITPGCRLSYGTLAVAGMLGAAVAGTSVHAHPIAAAIVGITGITALSSPLWISRLGSPQPTTVAWLEKAESLLVAAVFPLAAHLMGLFALIRGLG